MKKFKNFYFEYFSFDKSTLQAKFVFSFDEKEHFTEILDFKSESFNIKQIDGNILEAILFHIHLSLGISYYKLYPVENLIVKTGNLDKFQKNFWKKFYLNGLGEFFFRNKIDPSNLCNFVSIGNKKFNSKDFNLSQRGLVPIGGGKDSIVSIKLLEKINLDFDLFVLQTSIFGVKKQLDQLKLNTGKISKKDILLVKRYLDKKLLEFNKKGYYNGHVPITGIIAFVLLAVSYLYDYKYLILSNERSANFGNTLWNGLEINHQYSKSLEFENDFSSYVGKYISKEIKYFSLLRGMYEIKIAKLFSCYAKEYFNYFSSCNANFTIQNKQDSFWCNTCPKCVFVFAILSGFLTDKELKTIFGENLYENEKLTGLFNELLGLGQIKPFECVGEKSEVIYAMYLYLKNRQENLNKYLKNSHILKDFTEKVLLNITNSDLKSMENKLFSLYEDNIPNNIRQKILKIID